VQSVSAMVQEQRGNESARVDHAQVQNILDHLFSPSYRRAMLDLCGLDQLLSCGNPFESTRDTIGMLIQPYRKFPMPYLEKCDYQPSVSDLLCIIIIIIIYHYCETSQAKVTHRCTINHIQLIKLLANYWMCSKYLVYT